MRLRVFLAVWLGTMAFARQGLTSEKATAPSVSARVVRQYALTSANDFPQRDPQDWRLLGSNDGGQNWTILDRRQGEYFSERHQRRLFTLTNQAAFGLYRLQIDRVRDPAAADCVQVAEIEPLGESEDDLEPAPLITDLVTAQGENGPWETRFGAFDGRVETKWLDHATQHPTTRASWIQWQYTSPAQVTITNLSQLLRLGNRASHGYPVRIEGVVVGRLAGSSEVCILDGSDHFEIPGSGEIAQISPGQQVLVEGTSQWTGRRVQISLPRCQSRGLRAIQPKAILPEQTLAPGQELSWVEVQGKVSFCSWSVNHLVFELEEAERSISVDVLHASSGDLGRLPRGQVRIEGLCGCTLNSKGERLAGKLWAASLEAISSVALEQPATPAPGGPSRTTISDGPRGLLTTIEQIRRLSPEQLTRGPQVRLRGVVTELFGMYLQEDAAGVELWLRGEAAQQVPEFGSCIEIEGRADWAPGHGPVVRATWLKHLGKGKLPKPGRCTWSQLASGKFVDQWVEIEGVVRSTDGSHLLLACEGGQLMATVRSAPAPRIKALVDATVRVRGVSVAATDNRGQMQGIQLLVPSLEHVEIEEAAPDPFSLPARKIGSLLQVHGPKEFVHRIKVEGVLTFREDRKCFLQDATGGALAIAQEEVMLSTPPEGWSWLFWQSPNTNGARRLETQYQPGDRVEVVGFPETRGFSPILTEVLARRVGHAAPVQPVKATLGEIAKGGLDSTLVTLEAVVLRQEVSGPHWLLELQAGQRLFQGVVQAPAGAKATLIPGSRLRVTGVCQIEPLLYAELGKRVASFKLLVASPGQVIVLDRPSWWTLQRALIVVAALGVVLAMAGTWISVLRRQVEERTRQLQQEIEQHKQTEARLAKERKLVQAEVEERKRIEAEVERGHKQLLKASRLAGMAEVATSVLHNVGNVLNSVNVLASAIAESLHKSKVPSVGRLAGLLAEHRTELGRFITEDARGQQLPGYVGRLAAHLAQEQSRLRERIGSLTESIQHIKEIVAMQQNYARVSGVLETVSLAEIVDDALRIHGGAMARHQVRVMREYEPTPAATVDRHKVLQILFNLLENAKYACEQSAQAERLITVRLQRHGQDHVRLSVSDNGAGIPTENLKRIFAQGFSTRKGGHGFGLHSSLLAAQDMGASLNAQSDGPGNGATFVLEIPLRQGLDSPQ